MEILDPQSPPVSEIKSTPAQRLKFFGDGAQFFGILIVNAILTTITLGLYYPWARAKTMQYLWQETEFAGSRLTFHGTGAEMFKGFIKAVGLIVVVAIVVGLLTATKISFLTLLGMIIYVAAIVIITPLAIHGMLRYRTSRTSWRGIHMGYRGRLGELTKMYVKGILLTVVTLGIYGFWLQANVMRYIYGNIRLGNVKFRFDGEGTDYFVTFLKGYLLSIVTLGIYSFWWMRDLNRYMYNNIAVEQNGKSFKLSTDITAGDFFKIMLMSLLIFVTFGLALPWVMMYQTRKIVNSLELEAGFDPDAVEQTEEFQADATGEGMFDMLEGFDIGF
jgi:uncharacterized membrane protein YjgN (DUF898 family)